MNSWCCCRHTLGGFLGTWVVRRIPSMSVPWMRCFTALNFWGCGGGGGGKRGRRAQ